MKGWCFCSSFLQKFSSDATIIKLCKRLIRLIKNKTTVIMFDRLIVQVSLKQSNDFVLTLIKIKSVRQITVKNTIFH